MKSRHVRAALALATAVAAVGFGQTAKAADQYWDLNGATDGAGGPTPTGTWNTTNTNWNTDPLGGAAGAVGSWVSGDSAFFSAGSDATGAFTVTLSAVQNAGGLTVEEGTV